MCGIAGVLRFDDRPPDAEGLRRLGRRIAHRGPDDEGTFIDGPVGLAHRRLSILDLSDAAHQPMATPDGAGVLCYNGEVYNFKDLRAELTREGVRFRSSGDTEVLLEACRRWGVPEAARRANGMFAFAYWDASNRELWLARDRMGIKPLYYHRTGDRIAFASEIKALLDDAPTRPDPVSLLALLSSTPIYDPQTPFDGIHAVEAGQVVRVDSCGETELQRFFTLSEAVDPALYRELDRMPEREVVARFDSLMERSVVLHLASDAPVAAMASGGLDSSLVAHLTRRHLPQIVAYHANVLGPLSEYDWARRLAEYSQLPLRAAPLDANGFVTSLAEVTYANECPLNLHPNTVPFFLVCKLAADDGVKVLLTGEGADELFAGYPAFAANARRRRFEHWRDRVARVASWVGLGRVGRALTRYTTSDDQDGIRSRRSGLLTLGRSTRISQEGLQAYGFIPDRVEREFQVDLYSYLHAYLQSILWRNDRMGMAVGLESRVPFLENELIRHAVNLPMRYKLRRGENKWVLREVAARHLPSALSRRPKYGFPVDSKVYPDPGSDFFDDGFLSAYLAVGPEELTALRRCSLASPFQWLLIEIWGQLYFLGRSPAEVTERLTPRLGPATVTP
jgi:asparagine synthase (glutamine-hydrolysing)